MKQSKPRARIQDVAALAGVSPATASRALADHPKVTPKTKQKVVEAARTLRFRRNSLARDLRSGGVTTAVGYVIEDLVNPWFSQVAAGAERVFRKAELELIVATTEGDPKREQLVVKTMLERRVQALLLIPLSEDHSYLEGERQLGTPLIFVDMPPVNLIADSITIDNRGGMRLAVEHLAKHGHKRIGLLAGPEPLWTTGERLEGYKSGLSTHGIEFDKSLVRNVQYLESEVNSAALELLNVSNPPTALIATNNRITVLLLKSNKELLDKIAFVGFDDFELSELLGITVVTHDPLDIGREAALLTLERIENPLDTPQRREIGTTVIARGSGERRAR